MRKRKLIKGFVFIVMMVFVFTACAKSDMAKDENYGSTGDGKSTDMGSPEVGAPEEPSADYDSADGATTEEELANTSVISSQVPDQGTLDKIIRRVNMEVETQEFDDLINTIDQQIDRLGGYVESSQITGQRYYYKNDSRYGNIVARIPKDRLDEFINNIYDSANVIDKNESTENVTLQYINAESHKKTLEIEQERLLALLGKTETLEDILVLESRLSSIRFELQNYEIQLRTYDNLVEYSTVSLNITEVERISPVSEEKGNVWNRISTGFGDTIYNISEGLQNFLVWFVVNIPYIIIWAVIIIVGLLIGRRFYRKKYPKKIIKSEQTEENKKQ